MHIAAMMADTADRAVIFRGEMKASANARSTCVVSVGTNTCFVKRAVARMLSMLISQCGRRQSSWSASMCACGRWALRSETIFAAHRHTALSISRISLYDSYTMCGWIALLAIIAHSPLCPTLKASSLLLFTHQAYVKSPSEHIHNTTTRTHSSVSRTIHRQPK